MTDSMSILSRCDDYFQQVKENTERARRLEAARQNRDYYRGNQWTVDEQNLLESKGVRPITINRVLPTVNNLAGQQMANRRDIKIRPRRGGKEVVANIYTELVRHTMDQSDCEQIVAQCFQDGLYLIESFLAADIDKTETENGRIVVSERTIFNTAIDPESVEYDPNISAKFAILWDWVDKERIEIEYGAEFTKEGVRNNYDIGRVVSSILRQAGYDNSIDDENNSDAETDNRRKVFKFFWWESIKSLRALDPVSRTVVVLNDPKIIAQLRKSGKYKLSEVPGRRLHRSVICDGVVLEDQSNPFGDRTNMLPVSRFCAYWTQGAAFGVVDNIRSLNYEENVFRTEVTRQLKQTANSGWITNGGNPKDIEALEQFGSVNGSVWDKSKYGGTLDKIAPNQIPAGHFTVAQQFAQDSKEVSSVNDARLGNDIGRGESGRAIDLKQQQGMTTTQPIFDAFDTTLRIFGNFILRVIQNTGVYSENEVREIIGESGLISTELMVRADAELRDRFGGTLPAPANPQGLMPSPQQIATLQPRDRARVMQSAAMGIQAAGMYLERYPQLLEKWTELVKRAAVDGMIADLRDSRVSDYWVKVTLSPSSQTTRMANLLELSEIAKLYPGAVPPDIFIEATDLPNKEEIIKRLQQPQVPAAAGVQM